MSASARREIGDGGVLGELEAQQLRVEPAAADALDQHVAEGVIVQGLAGEIDREAERPALEHAGARLQGVDDVIDHPAVDHRHHLVARRGGQEAVGTDELAVLVRHAQQQLVVRARTLGGGKRQDQLRVQVQPALVDGAAQLLGDTDVGEAAHDADVGLLVDLDAIAAAVLGGLAGGLGGDQHVREFLRAGIQQRHADADRDRRARLAPAAATAAPRRCAAPRRSARHRRSPRAAAPRSGPRRCASRSPRAAGAGAPAPRAARAPRRRRACRTSR